MKFFQFSINQIVVLVAVAALVIVVWQWKLRPSQEERLAQALRVAVETNDLGSAARAIELGADPDPVSLSLLSFAVERKNRPMIDLLLAKGAIPQRAIGNVLRSGNAELLDDFIKRGSVPSWNDVKELIDRSDLNALQLILPHIESVKDSNNSTYRSNFDGTGDPQGWERLLLDAVSAPEKCRHQLIEMLLKDQTQTSLLALEQADWTKQLDVIEQLKTHGFRFGLPEMIALGQVDKVKALLKAKPQVIHDQQFNGPYPFGKSGVLALSLHHGHHEISRLLLDAGAPTEGPSQYRDVLIAFALSKPNVNVLRQLLDCSASWYDPRIVENDPPLDVLLRNSVAEPECVRLLLDAGAPLNETVGSELTLAIDGLARCNSQEYPRQIETIKILRLAGACQIKDFVTGSTSIDDYCLKKYGFQNLDELLDSRSLTR